MATATAIKGAPGVYQIRLGWSNAYLLGDGDSFALVDTGTPWDARRLERALARFGGLERCKTLILTHAHPDHAGCVAWVTRGSRAEVVAHENERPFLEAGRVYGRSNFQASVFKMGTLAWPVRPCRLSRAVEDGEFIETPAGTWRAIHTPGHTSGHLAFWREDGILISGDALLTVRPWTRRAGLTLAQPVFGEDQVLALESARRLSELRPRVLLPGHGAPLLDAAEPLRRFVQK